LTAQLSPSAAAVSRRLGRQAAASWYFFAAVPVFRHAAASRFLAA